MSAFFFRLFTFFFPGHPSPARQAHLICSTAPSMEAARNTALHQLQFAQIYGGPGEETYWLNVLQALERLETKQRPR